jgi:beta-1,4-mannosyltransferase
MIRFTVFPRLRILPHQKANPYIRDFVAALEQEKVSQVVNPPHKNPLFSLLPPKRWGDVFIFNWFESIPDSKYGPLQSVVAVCFVILLKLCGRKIVWVLHNKKPHAGGHARLKKFLTRFIAQKSDLILTHATEGVKNDLIHDCSGL